MQFNGEEFLLKHFNKTVVTWDVGGYTGGVTYSGALSPKGNLFLIFENVKSEDTLLESIFYLESGQTDKWVSGTS